MKLGRSILAALFMLLPVVLAAQGLDTAKIDGALGRSGQKSGEVYRVGFPRTDLHVTVAGVEVRPGFALGSWAAFSGTDDHAVVMGDLGLLEKEVNPVLVKLRAADFEITAVHNHVLDETPPVLVYALHGTWKGRGPRNIPSYGLGCFTDTARQARDTATD